MRLSPPDVRTLGAACIWVVILLVLLVLGSLPAAAEPETPFRCVIIAELDGSAAWTDGYFTTRERCETEMVAQVDRLTKQGMTVLAAACRNEGPWA